MGIDLCFSSLSLPPGREPDWTAAARAIDRIDPAVLLGTGDEWFPIDELLEGCENHPPDPAATRSFLLAARDFLREQASVARAFIEDPAGSTIHHIELPDGRRIHLAARIENGFHIEIIEPFSMIAEAGIARAAGFDGWTRYCSVPLDERDLGWISSEGQLRMAEVRAALTRELESGYTDGEPEPLLPSPWLPEQDEKPWLAWFVVRDFDWEAAERKAGDRPGLHEDLAVLRSYLVDDDFSRYVLSEDVGDAELWIAGYFTEYGARGVVAIEELGKAGVLDAAGVLCWAGRR